MPPAVTSSMTNLVERGVKQMVRGALALCLSLPLVARADDEYGASATVKRPVAARNDEDATAAATTVDLTQRPMALETLRDVMPEVPGTIAYAQGGYGAFSSVSLRGADLGQTVWLLGEIPLHGPDSGAFDMSLLPLPHLASLEVYRGGAPVWYGQGSIGGVIRVVPRVGEGTSASAQAGLGSFGRYELRGHSSVLRRRVSLFSGVQVGHARNDYPYVDDDARRMANTEFVERRLKNAQATDGSGLMHVRVRLGRGSLEAVLLGIRRVAGVPGRAGISNNALHTDRSLTRGLASLAYTHAGRTSTGRKYRVQLLSSAQGERRSLDDPQGELPFVVGALRQSQQRGTLRAAGSLELLSFLEASVVATYAGDRFEEHDASRPVLTGPSRRHTEALSTELRLFGRVLGMRSELRASQRSEWTQTALDIRRVQARVEEQHQLFRAVYRLAFSLEPVTGLNLRGALGSGARVPTITELFGDGAGMKHNFDLLPERGRYVDAGFVWSGSHRSLCGVLELNGFFSRVDDKIGYRTNSQGQAVADNFGRSDVRGVELGGDGSWGRWLRLVVSGTFMHTRAELERPRLPGERELQLPRQPKLRLYGRLESSVDFDHLVNRLTGFVSLNHVSTAYFDRANEILRVPQTHLGLGAVVGLWDDRFEVAGRVSDVLDRRGQDYLQFPLEGRAYFLLLSYREESL